MREIKNRQIVEAAGLSINQATLSRYFVNGTAPASPDLEKLARFALSLRYFHELDQVLVHVHQRRIDTGLEYRDERLDLWGPSPYRVEKLAKELQPIVESATEIVCEANTFPLWMLPRGVVRALLKRAQKYGGATFSDERRRGVLALDSMWRRLILSGGFEGRINVVCRKSGARGLLRRQYPFWFLSEKDMDSTLRFFEEEIFERNIRVYTRTSFGLSGHTYPAIRQVADFHRSLGTATRIGDERIIFNFRIDEHIGIEKPATDGTWCRYWQNWRETLDDFCRNKARELGDQPDLMAVLEQWHRQAIYFRCAMEDLGIGRIAFNDVDKIRAHAKKLMLEENPQSVRNLRETAVPSAELSSTKELTPKEKARQKNQEWIKSNLQID